MPIFRLSSITDYISVVKLRITHALVAVILSVTLVSSVSGQSSEMIPRVLLVDMARSQYAVLCGSDVFKQCMGFTDSVCSDLSALAIKQCLLPLPEEISPIELDNSAIESCPKQVFEDAGYSEEKAGLCFDEAMLAEGS